MQIQIVMTVLCPESSENTIKGRHGAPYFEIPLYRFKNTVTNPLFVVVDHIYHTIHGQNCLGRCWDVWSNPQVVKVGQIKFNIPFFWNGQLCKAGELVSWCFLPGRLFLSISVHFSNEYATLTGWKFIILAKLWAF